MERGSQTKQLYMYPDHRKALGYTAWLPLSEGEGAGG